MKAIDPLKKRKQAWLITVNTNSTNEKLSAPLKTVWRHITKNLRQFTYGIQGSKILEVREGHVIERGTKFHRIHLHSKLELTSNGLVNLDYSGIQTFFNKQLKRIPNFGGIYFNAKLVPNYNQLELIREYLEKAPLEEQEEEEKFEII